MFCYNGAKRFEELEVKAYNMRYIKLLLNLFVLALLFIFFAQNYEILSIAVQFRIPFTTIYTPLLPLYLIAIIMFIVGIIVTVCVTIREKIALQHELGKKNRALREKEEELIALRTLPLDTSVQNGEL